MQLSRPGPVSLANLIELGLWLDTQKGVKGHVGAFCRFQGPGDIKDLIVLIGPASGKDGRDDQQPELKKFHFLVFVGLKRYVAVVDLLVSRFRFKIRL